MENIIVFSTQKFVIYNLLCLFKFRKILKIFTEQPLSIYCSIYKHQSCNDTLSAISSCYLLLYYIMHKCINWIFRTMYLFESITNIRKPQAKKNEIGGKFYKSSIMAKHCLGSIRHKDNDIWSPPMCGQWSMIFRGTACNAWIMNMADCKCIYLQ